MWSQRLKPKKNVRLKKKRTKIRGPFYRTIKNVWMCQETKAVRKPYGIMHENNVYNLIAYEVFEFLQSVFVAA